MPPFLNFNFRLPMIKIVHIIWMMNPMKPLQEVCIDHNLIELSNTDWKLVIHTDNLNHIPSKYHEYCELIDPDLLGTYCSLSQCTDDQGKVRVAHVADLLRCRILLDHGGLYLDADDMLLSSPDKLVSNPDKLNILAETLYWFTNSLIYSPEPNYPELRELYNYILDSEVTTEKFTKTWAATGPYAVSHFFHGKYSVNVDPEETRNKIGFPSINTTLWTCQSRSIPCNIASISPKVSPLNWKKFHSMVDGGLVFDMNEFRSAGYSLCSMFGSRSDAPEYESGIICKFNTNSGYREILFGGKQ